MTKIKKTANTKIDERNEELETRLKRALADYQNLERRVEEERRLLSALSSAILIEKFLPVLDNLEAAKQHLNDQGLEIVIKQFKDILKEEGVSQIQAEGAQFDPHLHESVEVSEGENDNMIVKVVQKGYKINDKVIRPAKVVVERKTESSHPRKNEDQVPDQVFDLEAQNTPAQTESVGNDSKQEVTENA